MYNRDIFLRQMSPEYGRAPCARRAREMKAALPRVKIVLAVRDQPDLIMSSLYLGGGRRPTIGHLLGHFRIELVREGWTRRAVHGEGPSRELERDARARRLSPETRLDS